MSKSPTLMFLLAAARTRCLWSLVWPSTVFRSSSRCITSTAISLLHSTGTGNGFFLFCKYYSISDPDPHRFGSTKPVFRIRIRIHRTHMFLGLLDPDPDPSLIKQNSKKNLDSYCFVTSYGLLSLSTRIRNTATIRNEKNLHFTNSFVLTT